MAQGIVATGIVYRIVDTDGTPISGAELYTYKAGTVTPLPVYTDGGLTTPATNPVIMNINGEATIWFGLDDYKLLECYPGGAQIRPAVDNISGNLLTRAAADALYFPIGGTVDLSGSVLTGSVPLKFEGATDNAFETSLVITNPTADRAVTIQDKSGTLAVTNDETFSGTTTLERVNVISGANQLTIDSADIYPEDFLIAAVHSGVGDSILRLLADGSIRLEQDTVVAGDLSIEGAVSAENIKVTDPAGTFGYGTGAGGSVTQLTSKSTAVTLNRPSGMITMHNATLGAGASVAFTFTNSLITSSSIVAINPTGGAAFPWDYTVSVAAVGGGAVIRVTNTTASPLSEALQMRFVVLASAAS